MCLVQGCPDPVTPGVWWRDNADWKQYDAAQTAVVTKGVADGASRVDLGYVTSAKHGVSGARYVVDLCAMKQINLVSGYARDVKVIAPPAVTTPVVTVAPVSTPSPGAVDDSIREELRVCKKSIRSLKNMVLKLESDVLALRLQVLNDTAKRVAANVVTTANQALRPGLDDGIFKPRQCVSRGVANEACRLWERCDAGDYVSWASPEYDLSEDDC